MKFYGQKGDSNQPTAVDSSAPEGVEGLISYAIKVPNTIAGKRSDGYYGNQTGFTIEGWMDSESFIKNDDVDVSARDVYKRQILLFASLSECE